MRAGFEPTLSVLETRAIALTLLTAWSYKDLKEYN
jgi:hypothetical protein